ncbi:hypothetical protein [Magpiepox virus]|nr:hypothetical protein [Magpiepox virus]
MVLKAFLTWHVKTIRIVSFFNYITYGPTFLYHNCFKVSCCYIQNQ